MDNSAHTHVRQCYQFSSVQSLCDPINRATPGLPVHHQLPEFTQTHVHWVSDAIQPSHPLSYGSRWEWAHCHFCHTQVLRQGGLECCSPRGCQELDTTGERTTAKVSETFFPQLRNGPILEPSSTRWFTGFAGSHMSRGDPEDISICIQTLKVLVELVTPTTNPGSYRHLFTPVKCVTVFRWCALYSHRA